MTIQAGIYGATGYTGLELVRLLDHHPHLDLRFVTSESSAGQSLRHSHPQAPDQPLIAATQAPLDEVDIVFLCLPHTQSAIIAHQALDAGVRVVDLSADFRLNDPGLYTQWYHAEHPHPDLLPIPYGLPELADHDYLSANLIANPGCYATAVLLALTPLIRHSIVIPGTPLIADAKSGMTGAGRQPKAHTVFAEVHGNFSPYGIGRSHRHLPEIEQWLDREGQPPGHLIFTPHLLPTERGILATCYAQVSDMEAARPAFESLYADKPFADLLPAGEAATLAHIVHTPDAVISLHPVDDHNLIVISALDNLLKGAASQAVQNFNLMFGLPETNGLRPTQKTAEMPV